MPTSKGKTDKFSEIQEFKLRFCLCSYTYILKLVECECIINTLSTYTIPYKLYYL